MKKLISLSKILLINTSFIFLCSCDDPYRGTCYGKYITSNDEKLKIDIYPKNDTITLNDTLFVNITIPNTIKKECSLKDDEYIYIYIRNYNYNNYNIKSFIANKGDEYLNYNDGVCAWGEYFKIKKKENNIFIANIGLIPIKLGQMGFKLDYIIVEGASTQCNKNHEYSVTHMPTIIRVIE